MNHGYGRCAKGERLRMGLPYGHRKTTTLGADLRMSGMIALMVLDGPINGDWFEAYVAQVLVPELRVGDVVIMDNLSSHKRAAVRERTEAAGTTLCFLSSYKYRLHSNRDSVLTAQGNAPRSGRADCQRPMGPNRQTRRYLPS